jgi:hypothetical protein
MTNLRWASLLIGLTLVACGKKDKESSGPGPSEIQAEQSGSGKAACEGDACTGDAEYQGPAIRGDLQLRDFDALKRTMTSILEGVVAPEKVSEIHGLVAASLPKNNHSVDAFLPAQAIAQMQFASRLCDEIATREPSVQQAFFGMPLGTEMTAFTDTERFQIARALLLHVGDGRTESVGILSSAISDLSDHLSANAAEIARDSGINPINPRVRSALLGCSIALSSVFVSMY